MKRKTRKQRTSRVQAERERLYSQAFEFAEALWDWDYMQCETREEFEEIGRLAREAKLFVRQLPKGKFRRRYYQALERRYHGIFWAVPTPVPSLVEEDPIGQQFSDHYRRVDKDSGDAA